jgi:ATP-binding cassette subfamily B protein
MSLPMPDGALRPRRRLVSRADSAASSLSDRFLVQMLAAILRPYQAQIGVVFLLLILVTLLSLLPPYLVQQAVDGPITSADPAGLIPIGLIYFSSIAAVFVLRFAYTYLLQTVGQNALVDLRQQLFEHIVRQDMRFFNTTPVGQIVSRMSNDIEALTELLSTSIVMVVSNMFTLVGIVIVMFLINWRLALLGTCVLPIMIVATVYWRKRIRAASNRLHRLIADYLAFVNEALGGMLIIQLFGRQTQTREAFAGINGDYRLIHGSLRDAYTSYSSVLQLLTTVGIAVVLYFGSQGVIAQWATLGMLIAFIEYTRRSYEPILQLAEQFAQIQTALSAGERVARMLQVQPEIPEPKEPVRIEPRNHGFAFEHVSFGYEPGALVLRDVSFEVSPGQRVAIVGATGAGKTSLAGLIARYYDVNEGRVLIDGVDVRQIATPDLRSGVTVVPQNPYCFHDTIRENLKLYDPQITDEAMMRAAELACAAPFISRLPQGYDYRLLPGGANLSQGQRQLIALTRALLHYPHSILVLDEATSSIDTETERWIQQGLAQALTGRTSLVIAHRLSTIRDADCILVMQRGRLVEQGTHEALLRQNGIYAQLHRRQFHVSDPESAVN